MAGDIKVISAAHDRFYNTDLDAMLKAKGIDDAHPGRLEGRRLRGLHIGRATLHGYTVVVPMDTTTAANDYETTIGFFQILHQSDANATNEPLKQKASTLSRTDSIRSRKARRHPH